MALRVKVVAGSAPPHTEYAIPENKVITFGRMRPSNVLVHDRKCSKEHCRVSYVSGQIQVIDLGSRNGTFVNGQRIRSETVLQSGDRLRIGDCEFLFTETAEQSASLDAGSGSAPVPIGLSPSETAARHCSSLAKPADDEDSYPSKSKPSPQNEDVPPAFIATSSAAKPSPAPAAGLSSNRVSEGWWVRLTNGEESGPHDLSELCDAIEAGEIEAHTMVRKVSWNEWRKASDAAELTSLLPSAGTSKDEGVDSETLPPEVPAATHKEIDLDDAGAPSREDALLTYCPACAREIEAGAAACTSCMVDDQGPPILKAENAAPETHVQPGSSSEAASADPLFCPSCGSELSPDVIVCTTCKTVNSSVEPALPKDVSAPPKPLRALFPLRRKAEAPTAGPSRAGSGTGASRVGFRVKRCIILGIVGAVLIVGVVFKDAIGEWGAAKLQNGSTSERARRSAPSAYAPRDGMKVWVAGVGGEDDADPYDGLYHGRETCPMLVMKLANEQLRKRQATLQKERLVDRKGLFHDARACDMCFFVEETSGDYYEDSAKAPRLEGQTFHVATWENIGWSTMGYGHYHLRQDCPVLKEESQPRSNVRNYRSIDVTFRKRCFVDRQGFFHPWHSSWTSALCPRCVE